MFNDPEWATKEEWDAYAWFGFALSEAQTIEMQLQIIATALAMNASQNKNASASWTTLYDRHGRLTLGQLLRKITTRTDFTTSEDLTAVLQQAVSVRNQLTHHFIRTGIIKTQTALAAVEELRSSASLLSHVSSLLHREIDVLLNSLHISKREAEAQRAKSCDTSK